MRVRELGISAALLVCLGAGCANKSDILTGKGELGSSDNPWQSCTSDPAGFIAKSKLGDHCSFGGACSMGPGAVCGTIEYRTCQNGLIFSVDTETLDCPLSGFPPDAGSTPAYSDCLTALQQGKTGDSCTWQDAKSCAVPSQEPCCVDLAVCGCYPPGGLRRAHVCAPGCENLTPAPGLPVLTACPTGNPMNSLGLGSPCEGNFMCVGPFSELTWCDHGVVVGGEVDLWMCPFG
jgi:hypothetical protein